MQWALSYNIELTAGGTYLFEIKYEGYERFTLD
ncbi:MAG: hypothetical protein ACI9F1_001409 [Colwellia sp.]|jgi:hypothetical protein